MSSVFGGDLTPINALTILDDVPEELRGHETMKGVTAKVIEVLTGSLNTMTQSYPPTASEKDTKQRIADALATALGPVNQFFGEGTYSCFYTCLPLKPHILALSPGAIEALLASDALQVATENEVYTFWVPGSTNPPMPGPTTAFMQSQRQSVYLSFAVWSSSLSLPPLPRSCRHCVPARGRIGPSPLHAELESRHRAASGAGLIKAGGTGDEEGDGDVIGAWIALLACLPKSRS